MPVATADLSADAIAYYARQADREAKGPQLYGGQWTKDLRALFRYHKDALQDIELGGKVRMVSHKQMAMAGAIARISVTQERATVTSIAREANCAPSTASRFILKLQAWNAYAIDVTRGRYGGVRIRLRGARDGLHGYAERAWLRIKQAAEKALSRTKFNVASTTPGQVKDTSTSTVVMDATLKPGERYGCVVRGCEQDHPSSVPLSRTARAADEEWARAEAFAAAVIAERRLLDAGDPDWDVYLDQVRASYGMTDVS